jgi:spore photoproduct lyase
LKLFKPSTVIFRENALDYPLGKKLHKLFTGMDKVETRVVSARGPFPGEKNLCFREKFIQAKKTMVVSVRSTGEFQTCKPSAHYQLPLVTGCPAHCQYCYLSTNLGKNPYIKVYVNLEEILKKAENYIEQRKPEITIFEGAATSDPLPVERWTGSLAYFIEAFAHKELGRFRFVTKFTDVDSLLGLDHRGKTEFRFSLNSCYAVKKFEPTTPSPEERIEAARKVYKAGYPLGFLIAPLFIYEGWEREYNDLIEKLQQSLNTKGSGISFELITHRFTERARKIIEEIYPRTKLPMDKEEREFKYGQFGYGKYVYPADKMKEIKEVLTEAIKKYFPEGEIKYFV